MTFLPHHSFNLRQASVLSRQLQYSAVASFYASQPTPCAIIPTNVKNVWRCRDSRTAKSKETSRNDGIKQFSI